MPRLENFFWLRASMVHFRVKSGYRVMANAVAKMHACQFSSCASTHWLRDDISLRVVDWGQGRKSLQSRCFSNVTFVMENFVMIVMFYFSQHSHSWFFVLFGVLGNITRTPGVVFSSRRRQECWSSDINNYPAEMIYITQTILYS